MAFDARAWHFFFAWVFALSGLACVLYAVASRRLAHDLAPTREDLEGIGASVRDHLRFRHPTGEAARRYHVLQKLAYLVVIFGPLPARTQITRLDCVEGWSAIGKWKGTPLAALLDFVRPKPEARYVMFYCADPMASDGTDLYYESVDLDDALHPQTILAYDMNDAPLPVPNGAPVRRASNGSWGTSTRSSFRRSNSSRASRTSRAGRAVTGRTRRTRGGRGSSVVRQQFVVESGRNRCHAALQILARYPTSLRFAPCLAPISTIFANGGRLGVHPSTNH